MNPNRRKAPVRLTSWTREVRGQGRTVKTPAIDQRLCESFCVLFLCPVDPASPPPPPRQAHRQRAHGLWHASSARDMRLSSALRLVVFAPLGCSTCVSTHGRERPGACVWELQTPVAFARSAGLSCLLRPRFVAIAMSPSAVAAAAAAAVCRRRRCRRSCCCPNYMHNHTACGDLSVWHCIHRLCSRVQCSSSTLCSPALPRSAAALL
jgi:hypothetical protein